MAEVTERHLVAPGAEEGQWSRFILPDGWKAAYRVAAAGILAMHDVANPASHPASDTLRAELQRRRWSRLAGSDRAAVAAPPAIQA